MFGEVLKRSSLITQTIGDVGTDAGVAVYVYTKLICMGLSLDEYLCRVVVGDPPADKASH